MIRPASYHNCKFISSLKRFQNFLPLGNKSVLKICKGGISFFNSFQGSFSVDGKCFIKPVGSLFCFEFFIVPVKNRMIKINAESFIYLIAFFNNHGITLKENTGMVSESSRVFPWNPYHKRIEYPVYTFCSKLLYMTMEKLCRKTDCI